MAGKAGGIVDADRNGEDMTPFTVTAGVGARGSPRRDNSPKRTRGSPSPNKGYNANASAHKHSTSQMKQPSLVEASQEEPPVKPFKPDDSKDKLLEAMPEVVPEEKPAVVAETVVKVE